MVELIHRKGYPSPLEPTSQDYVPQMLNLELWEIVKAKLGFWLALV
jgi:folate-binding Fe-S cluster repair protein YgfZ